VVLGFELQSVCLSGRHTTSWAMRVPALLACMYFLDKFSNWCLCLPGLRSSYLGLPYSWDGVCHHVPAQILLRWGLRNSLPCVLLASNRDPPHLRLHWCSEDYRHEPPLLAPIWSLKQRFFSNANEKVRVSKVLIPLKLNNNLESHLKNLVH
jgi:hypothetical protein